MSPPEFTAEQQAAIDRREGDLLLEASAGSGKTSVLVERFTRAVADDGVAVGAILAITFTEKAAAELRDRIRVRFRALGLTDASRATEGAFISTIHGFCARILRGNALAAGLDPRFQVLDETTSARLAGLAFERALAAVGNEEGQPSELIAAYGPDVLHDAITSLYAELRARGERSPHLPPAPVAPELADLRTRLRETAADAARELGVIPDPGAKVLAALTALERCDAVLGAHADPWPGGLRAAVLRRGAKALESEACGAYAEALEEFRAACAARRAGPAIVFLDRLLRRYGAEYEALKRERSGVDFEDLELLTRDLLRRHDALRERLRTGFAHVMVDELQDTNRVQLDLIELVCRENLFTVGDAQQSIYGFRHADVALFEALTRRRGEAGALATLTVNFRSRPELIEALNRAFEDVLGDRFRPLRAGRLTPPASEPVVEMILCDRDGGWEAEGTGPGWRFAEAAALAERVAELVRTGAASAGEIVVLTRAGTDLRTYERALEDRGVPTYLIGGRGYWSHPQVIDLVCYLRALANPLDEEALFTVLASPLARLSIDALVILVALAREARIGVWELAASGSPQLADELAPADLAALTRFVDWFAPERSASAHVGVHALVDRALWRSGYELQILALPGGVRRMANVRKLMRLGREYEADAGPDLRGFLDLVHARGLGEDQSGGEPDPRESEAPVESEALDAVRLMTIHRAKGLEFPVVCVADLGRGPVWRGDVVRVGTDGRIGVRLEEPGTAGSEPALDFEALGEERRALDGEEERRLFYVAMTRAQERLVLSGAAKFERWERSGRTPVMWIAPAFVPDVAERALAWVDGDGAGEGAP